MRLATAGRMNEPSGLEGGKTMKHTGYTPGLVKITSHVNPPMSCTYTLGEFLEANASDFQEGDMDALLMGRPIRMGGGAAPIVDVVPEGGLAARVARLEEALKSARASAIAKREGWAIGINWALVVDRINAALAEKELT